MPIIHIYQLVTVNYALQPSQTHIGVTVPLVSWKLASYKTGANETMNDLAYLRPDSSTLTTGLINGIKLSQLNTDHVGLQPASDDLQRM